MRNATETLTRQYKVVGVLVICLLLLMSGCDRQTDIVTNNAILSELNVWVHTGNKESLLLIQDQVSRFNASHNRIRLSLTSVPKGTYLTQINAAILTGTLPDIIELDGPYLYNFAERDVLIKLDKILTETTHNDILPTVFQQGMYEGRLYSLAATSNSIVMYARKSAIQAAGYRLPEATENAWSVAEFEQLLELVIKNRSFSAALDLGINHQNEWLTRVLLPMLLSAGGGMIDEQSPTAGNGVLNSRINAAVLSRVQRWIKNSYVDKNLDNEAFIRGRVAFSWAGLEKYDAYKGQFGDDLVVVPLPDFGRGSVRVQRGWGWSITNSCEDTQAAMRFLEFLFQPEEVLLAAKANAILPATYSALARYEAFNGMPSLVGLIEEYKQGTLYSQSKSPLYSVISDAFQKAFIRIRNGAETGSSLDTAIKVVERGRQKFESELERSRREAM